MYIEFDIPEFTQDLSGFLRYWFPTLFGQSVFRRYEVLALSNNYVRLVDSAIFEYGAGTYQLKKFWSGDGGVSLGAFHQAVSHFEICITNTHRATKLFRRLRRDRQRGQLARTLSDKSLAASFATDEANKILRDIRNDIHHIDDAVLKRAILPGQPFSIKPDGPEMPHSTEPNQTIKTIDRLIVGARELRFVTLNKWLSEMTGVVGIIADLVAASESLD